MKRVIAATAAVLAIGLGASAGHAAPVSIECGGTVVAGTGSCSVQFELDDARFVSLLGTHANFHAPLAMGSLQLTWIDAADAVAAQYTCTGLGLPSPLDEHRLLCTEDSLAAAYTSGVQTLVVEVLEADGEGNEFHGGFSFGEEGDLI